MKMKKKKNQLVKTFAKALLGLEAILVGVSSVNLEYETHLLRQRDKSFYASFLVPPNVNAGSAGGLNGPSQFSEIIWQNRPNVNLVYNGKRVETNSASIRDNQEHSKVKGSNSFRIIGIGDSFTFGSGTALEDTYLKVLERMLNREGNHLHYEVLNFGVPGFSAKQEVAMYEYIAREYNPDLVILTGFFSDNAFPCALRVPKGWMPGQDIDPSFFNPFSNAPSDVISSDEGNYSFEVPKWYRDNFSGTERDIKEAYDRLRCLTDRDKAPVVLTMVYYKLKEKLPREDMHLTNVMLESGKRMGFHISDPYWVFKDYLDRNGLESMSSLQISETDLHFREEANAILALTLYNTIVRDKLIPDADKLAVNGLDNMPFFEDVSLDVDTPQKPFNRLDFEFNVSLFNRINNLHCETESRVYKLGEPITGRVEVRNISPDERTVSLSRNIRRKGYSAVGDKNLLIRLYKAGLGEDKEVYCNWGGGLEERTDYVRVGIAPGASNAFSFSIPQEVVEGLEYGNYRLEIAYFGADPMSYRPCTKELNLTVRSCRWEGQEHEREMRKLHDELKIRRNDISRRMALERGKKAYKPLRRGTIGYGGF